MYIAIEESIAMILQQLAQESGMSPDEFLKKLIKHEDSERHLVDVPGEGFVRFNCLRKGCKETRIKTKSYYGEGSGGNIL